MNIYQKMSAITAELQTVAKNLSVDTGRGNSYKAVSERDILDAVKPLEVKHGVYSYPVKRTLLESEVLESESTYKGETRKKTTFFMRVETVYRFVNADAPEEYIETTVYGDGMDSGDKGPGKAMTYGDKYALMKAYKISTGDDPDQEGSQDTMYTRKDRTLICADCGKPISDFGHVPADAIARSTMGAYGRQLCYDCGMKAKEAKEAGKNA